MLDSGLSEDHDPPGADLRFRLRALRREFEELVRSDAPPPACPTCGNEETERLLSTFLTPNMASGQRRFQRSAGVALAEMGCCGGGGCGTHTG